MTNDEFSTTADQEVINVNKSTRYIYTCRSIGKRAFQVGIPTTPIYW